MQESIFSIAEKYRNRSLKVADLVTRLFTKIESEDKQILSFLELFKTQALEKAEALDARFDKGDALPLLAGMPLAVKDNICMRGFRTTCASKILENYVSPYTSTAMEKLNAHHVIPMGRTNMDEFAMGSSTENSAYQVTKNPWNLSHAPGGSSGGSAAAVAAGFAPLSLGSDTGGSIRQPAAYCGISGLKPSYGRISRYGLVAFASSLDQIGPFARSVEELAVLTEALCGGDIHDATSLDLPAPNFKEALKKDVKGLKIGVPSVLLGDKIAANVKAKVIEALDLLKSEGATWETFEADIFNHSVPTYYILAPAEASANLARFDGVRYGYRCKDAKNIRDLFNRSRGEGFGPEVQRRIIIGTYVLSAGYYDAYYLKAQKVRTLFKQSFDEAFKKYDVVISPTSPTTAFELGSIKDPVSVYLADLATIPANLAGLPGLSIPCGFADDGLPVGLQIMGKHLDEETVLRVGHYYQQKTQYHLATPKGMIHAV